MCVCPLCFSARSLRPPQVPMTLFCSLQVVQLCHDHLREGRECFWSDVSDRILVCCHTSSCSLAHSLSLLFQLYGRLQNADELHKIWSLLHSVPASVRQMDLGVWSYSLGLLQVNQFSQARDIVVQHLSECDLVVPFLPSSLLRSMDTPPCKGE